MADNDSAPMPGPNEFSADQEKQMRTAARAARDGFTDSADNIARGAKMVGTAFAKGASDSVSNIARGARRILSPD